MFHRRRALVWGLALVGSLSMAACSDDDEGSPTGPGDEAVSYVEDVQSIFDRRCAVVCHNASSPNGQLRLTADVSHAELVGVAAAGYVDWVRVVAGEPDSSLLYRKLLPPTGETGNRMPLNQSEPLSDADIETIRAWIAEGARND